MKENERMKIETMLENSEDKAETVKAYAACDYVEGMSTALALFASLIGISVGVPKLFNHLRNKSFYKWSDSPFKRLESRNRLLSFFLFL